jgi:hypothetical protein
VLDDRRCCQQWLLLKKKPGALDSSRASKAEGPSNRLPAYSRKNGQSDRGLIQLISPRRTLTSCGKFSMRLYRRNRPTRVNSPSTSRDLCCCAASKVVQRNLYAMKIPLLTPGRRRWIITGPGLSHLMASVTSATKGSTRMHSVRATRDSSRRSARRRR